MFVAICRKQAINSVLPELISGEIRVKDAEKVVEEAL